MSDPNTDWPEYAKHPAFADAPLLVIFLTMYGTISLVIDIARVLIWIIR